MRHRLDPLRPTPPPAWVLPVLLAGALALAASYVIPTIQSWRALSAAFGVLSA